MNIGIAGAGITGLTAAYFLSKKGHKITLFEKDTYPGGLAASVPVGDCMLEKLYHHIFTSDIYLLNLIEELEFEKSLIWSKPSNGIYINNKLYPFTTPIDLIRFNELPFNQRIRLGLLIYRAAYMNDIEKIEKETAKNWIIKNAGRMSYEKLWGPLLESKFDVDAERVSAAWIWNKFKLRGSTRAEGISKEQLGYIRGSMSVLNEKLVYEIKQMEGKINFSCEVKIINPSKKDTLEVNTAKGQEYFDCFIFTGSPELFEGVLSKQCVSDYLANIRKIKYKANICMVIELRKSLSEYYWITVADKDSPFVLVIEHTNMISDRHYGSNIVYLSRYLDEDNVLYNAEDESIKEMFFGYLKKMFPQWKQTDVMNTSIYRSRYAQPVITQEYSKNIPAYWTPIKNLYLASMCQIYPEDRGINYAVKMGEEVAGILCDPAANSKENTG